MPVIALTAKEGGKLVGLSDIAVRVPQEKERFGRRSCICRSITAGAECWSSIFSVKGGEHMESKIRILNAGYTNLTAQELLDCLMEDVGKRQKSSVIFLNVDVVMKLEKIKSLQISQSAQNMCWQMECPPVWVSKLFHRPLKEKGLRL